MGVSNRVREIENEIDASIRELTIWQVSRVKILEELMRIYRDAIEVVFIQLLDAKTFDGSPEDYGDAFGNENQICSGILWALKWALEYCPESGPSATRSPDELGSIIRLGANYEAFVDVLKLAQCDLVTIHVDEASRTIICYEGDQATTFDTNIVRHQRINTPTTHHASLTENSDQLTSRWTAGDYRRVTKSLANYAASKEDTILGDPAILSMIGKPKYSIPQPTLVWFDRPSQKPDYLVFDDLVLPTVIDTQVKWKLVSFLDTPIVKVRDKYCALSSDIKTISVIDDHMLRLAARVDKRQYDLATLLREDRMIKICRHALERCPRPWTVAERVSYADPSQEADILSVRGTESFVLELKSTLRPETPWEVYKRNEDIIKGIKQTRSLIDRGEAKYGFVVTDGYRGDYMCWAEALTRGIPIGTLYDLDAIANDPVAAVTTLKNLVGITASTPESREMLMEREDDLLNWKLRCVDMNAPAETTT